MSDMLTVNELFSGIGTQAYALEYSNIPHRIIGQAEIEKNAISAYNAGHGATRNYGDISKIESLDYADLWTYSFPCFTGDTLVLTNSGYKKMLDVTVEDEVYTHKSRFRPVLKKFDNGVHEIWNVKTSNVDVIRTTENHKFYVVTKSEKWNKTTHKYDTIYSEPYWKECFQLTKNDYILSPTYNIKNKVFYTEDKVQVPEFYWILGKYLGDGCLRGDGTGIVVRCSKKKKERIELEEKLDNLGIYFSKFEGRTFFTYTIFSMELYEYCKKLTSKETDKRLSSDILNLKIEYLKEFIAGYIFADGCKVGNKYKIASMSRELLYGIGMCVTKCYNVPFKLSKSENINTPVIDGVPQNDFYHLIFDLIPTIRRATCVYLHNNYWYSILEVVNTGEKEQVYDIEVKDDNSLVVQGLCSHNCQDLSSGGKGKGVNAVDSEGNAVQTRSGLLWEVERLLERACGYTNKAGKLVKDNTLVNTAPKFLLLENVPELVNTKKHYVNFLKWKEKLTDLGYETSWAILNAKDFGIPQNRERVYCVSIRKDIYTDSFVFPTASNMEDFRTNKRTANIGSLCDFVDKSVMDYNGPLMIDPRISNYLLEAYNRDLVAISQSDKPIWTCKCKSGFQDHRVGIDYAPTIRHQNQHTAVFINNQIHKLTACECWKLMGIREEDYWKVKEATNLSDTILCGLAGNAIVVQVIMCLFQQLWSIDQTGKQELEKLSFFL